MIECLFTVKIRNIKYIQGFRIKNLEEDKNKIILKSFKNIYRKLIYQICIDIDGMTKKNANIYSQILTHEYFGL